MLGVTPLVRIPGFFLLEVAAVGKDDAGERCRVGGGVDGALESGRDQAGDVADMVEVGMGDHDGVESAGIERWVGPVPQPQLLGALVQPTVDEDRGVAVVNQELAAGDRSDATRERERAHVGSRSMLSRRSHPPRPNRRRSRRSRREGSAGESTDPRPRESRRPPAPVR